MDKSLSSSYLYTTCSHGSHRWLIDPHAPNRRMTINVFPYAPNDPPVPRKLEVAHLQHKLLYKDIVLEKKQKTHMNM